MRSAVFFILVLMLAAPLAAAPITYQGQLQQSGQLVDGGTTVDMTFRLFDQPEDGSIIGLLEKSVTPQNGLFQVELDFGPGVFDGSPRYLEIQIFEAAPLSPRQAVTATPVALYALDGNEGPAGPQGETGPQGPAGDSANIDALQAEFDAFVAATNARLKRLEEGALSTVTATANKSGVNLVSFQASDGTAFDDVTCQATPCSITFIPGWEFNSVFWTDAATSFTYRCGDGATRDSSLNPANGFQQGFCYFNGFSGGVDIPAGETIIQITIP